MKTRKCVPVLGRKARRQRRALIIIHYLCPGTGGKPHVHGSPTRPGEVGQTPIGVKHIGGGPGGGGGGGPPTVPGPAIPHPHGVPGGAKGTQHPGPPPNGTHTACAAAQSLKPKRPHNNTAALTILFDLFLMTILMLPPANSNDVRINRHI